MNSQANRTGGRRYEIQIKGHLAQHWSDWLGNLEISNHEDGCAYLRGSISDQAALHGILAQLRSLGLDLIAVRPLEGKT